MGVSVHLELDTGEGYLLARDDTSFHDIDTAIETLATWGFEESDADFDGHAFEDGATGVKIWLNKKDGA